MASAERQLSNFVRVDRSGGVDWQERRTAQGWCSLQRTLRLQPTLPSPLRADGGHAEIYLKREDLNHTGAHKINNSLGQALLCKRLNKQRIIAETGAGQHGVATVRRPGPGGQGDRRTWPAPSGGCSQA